MKDCLDVWLTLVLKNVRLTFCLCVLLTLWISSTLAKTREEKSSPELNELLLHLSMD